MTARIRCRHIVIIAATQRRDVDRVRSSSAMTTLTAAAPRVLERDEVRRPPDIC
jgi:hypothetical protein